MTYLDLVLMYLQLLLLFLKFNCEIVRRVDQSADTVNLISNWKCSQMDEAQINFRFNPLTVSSWDNDLSYLIVKYQYIDCNKCNLVNFVELRKETNYENNKTIDSFYSYKFEIITNTNEKICKESIYSFNECGNYLFDLNKCELILLNDLPFNSNNYIYIVLTLAILLIIGFNFAIFIYSKYFKAKVGTLNEDVELRETPKTESTKKDSTKKTKRLESLDTFRGLSLVLMIFVNYGSGGYKQLQHMPWHGITIADFVFPWFLFIMGVSTAISINVLLQKQKKTKFQVFIKIVIRSIKLFAIGIILNSRFGVYLSQLRIFGVLQRISLCYLFVATLECIFHKNINENENLPNKLKKYLIDLIKSWAQWLVIILMVVVWFLLTYLLPVPDCPKGYLGAGGLDNYEKHKNCLGGAAGYIDRLIIGNNHLYARPTSMKIYQTTQPFDPEGILGTFNSILLTYLGVQAGKIIIYHKSNLHRMILWSIWSLLTFILFAVLTFFDLENGPIPVNKNLWTLTFTLITASSSFLIILILYFIIDIKHWWNGSPIIYPGMNSIIIYFFHLVFRTTFPSQWLVSNTHVAQLFLNFWGVIFWTGVATYLYFKKLFYNL